MPNTTEPTTPESAPLESTRESAAPESAAPESATPESAIPESAALESVAPESVTPESAAPETIAPKSIAPESPETTAPQPTELTEPTHSKSSDTKRYFARLTRDDRIRVLTLRDAGLTYQQISVQLRISHRQVQYTCQSQQLDPKKPPGQRPKLSEEDVDRIIAFISSSERNRQMAYHKIIQEMSLPVGTTALARALEKRGYTRRNTFRKPPLSEKK